MSELLNKGQTGPDDSVSVVEQLLTLQKKAGDLNRQFNAKREFYIAPSGDAVPVYHEVFVIGEAKPWRPTDQGGRHIGWALYSITPIIYDDGKISLKRGDTVCFADINNKTPLVGDLAHFKRSRHILGRWLSVEIIQE